MRSAIMAILYACVMLVHATELSANDNGLEQKMSNRMLRAPSQSANLDSSTLAKAPVGKPMASGSVALGQRVAPPATRRFVSKVPALKDTIMADRYGRAIYEAAKSANDMEGVKGKLDSIKLAMDEIPEFNRVLTNPVISQDKKKEVVKGIIGDGPATNFCNLVIDDLRPHVIRNAIDKFEMEYNMNEQIQVATVISACEMDEETLLAIAKKVQDLVKCKSVKIKPVIDKSIIGGFIIDIGNKRIDMSFTDKLKKIEAAMDVESTISNLATGEDNLGLPSAESLMPAQPIGR